MSTIFKQPRLLHLRPDQLKLPVFRHEKQAAALAAFFPQFSDGALFFSAGVEVVAILRNSQLLANPKSNTVFEVRDRIGLFGDQEQIEAIEQLLAD